MKICRYCKDSSHTQFYCTKKPKAVIKAKKKLNKVGKYGKQWLKTRETWFTRNAADWYYCYICGKQMTYKETTLDHIKSRSRNPGLRFELTNLAPCCWTCNERKGSKDLEEMERLHGRNEEASRQHEA